MEKQVQWLRWLAALIWGTAVITILLILAGVFDPKPVGDLAWQQSLTRQSIPRESSQIIWLDETISSVPFTVRLTAAYASGEKDIGYGMVIGNEGHYAAVFVSPLGYAAISQKKLANEAAFYVFPWQTWPHIKEGKNEIWIDVLEDQISVRINREILWAGDLAVDPGRLGLAVESFGETAVVDFQKLELYQ